MNELGISKVATSPTIYESMVAKGIIQREGTPEAVKYFERMCGPLTDYTYWFFLSTCWVSYTGYSDLSLWKRLFSSGRNKRNQSIMKPSELIAFKRLPYFITIYRAHRLNEDDWIAYTLDPAIAARFACERSVSTIKEYKVRKTDILALFLRRGEKEILVLDKEKVQFVREIEVVGSEVDKGE